MAGSFKYAVFISGRGSNLQALIEQAEAGLLPAKPCLVVSDRPKALGLELARKAGIPTRIVEREPKRLSSEQFNVALLGAVDDFRPDLIVLAGFMRIIHPVFIRPFRHRIINIHPSLLPSFPGAHAQKDALEAGVRIAGATVHFVEEAVDGGPIIMQAAVPVFPSDTVDSLSGRILTVEHTILPRSVALIAEGRVRVEQDQRGFKVTVDGVTAQAGDRLFSPLPES